MATTSTNSATATAYISGAVSGLDTSSILSQLRSVESGAVNQLTAEQTTLNTALSTWQSFNTKLLAFRSALDTLSTVSTFKSCAVSVSNQQALSATVTGYPAVSDTTFTIVALAQAGEMASQGYADADTTLVGAGSFTINGQVVTTDGLTLNGLRDAINAAGAGVTASVVNTGAGDTPYRLLLTSKTTGAAGAISVTGTVGGFTTVQEAQDAHLQFGSGDTALDVYRPSNHITDVISGVSLDLSQATTGPVTVSARTDLSAVKDDVADDGLGLQRRGDLHQRAIRLRPDQRHAPALRGLAVDEHLRPDRPPDDQRLRRRRSHSLDALPGGNLTQRRRHLDGGRDRAEPGAQ